MASCKTAFIGAGNMASEHIKAFDGLAGVKLGGIHSRTRARADRLASRYPGLKVYDSIGALYEGTLANLVVVTVNELSMGAVAAECFTYPWTVFLEKPAGHNLTDAIGIVQAARSRGSRVFVALNRRAYSSTRIAIGRLRDNDGPRFIKVQDQQDQEAARLIYKEPEAVVENYMYANSIHLIDYFRVFGRGEITAVEPIVAWDPGKPGIVLARVAFSSGDIGLYEGLWNGPGPWAVTVSTPRERIELRPLENVTVQLRGERKLSQLVTEPIDTAYKPGLRHQAEQAVVAATGGVSDLPSIEDSLRSMELVGAIFGLGA